MPVLLFFPSRLLGMTFYVNNILIYFVIYIIFLIEQ